jgi:hypothetical protein
VHILTANSSPFSYDPPITAVPPTETYNINVYSLIEHLTHFPLVPDMKSLKEQSPSKTGLKWHVERPLVFAASVLD